MQLGFIDFSKEERNKVLATLKLLGDRTALDELGIGIIRDAFADILFPGISTLQTRAKYFVLIPYIFAKAEKQTFNRRNEVLQWINNTEDKLVDVLVRSSDTKETGIIGSDAAKQKRVVKMKPSSIYWNGLRTFEILRNSKMSLGNACDIIMAKSQKVKVSVKKSDGETFDDQTANDGNFILFSPLSPDYNFENEVDIALTKNEAEFLSNKIIKAQASGSSLLAFLIKEKLNVESFDEMPISILPQNIKRYYLLAKGFADFILGAHLRYNVIYSNYEDTDMVNDFECWKENFDFNNFNLNAIFESITCNYSTQKFCEDFLKAIMKDDFAELDRIIIARERSVKGDRAKLQKPTEYSYTHVHYYKLNYRFGTARTIISDIIKGLKE